MPRRRKGSTVWYTNFRAPDGRRIRVSTGTRDRQQAQEYEDRLRAEFWRVHRLGERPRRVWQEAVKRWLKETDYKRSDDDKLHFRTLDPYFRDSYLDAIDRDAIERFIEGRQSQGVAPATINRTLALLRAVLRRAWRDWGWLDSVPAVRMLSVENKRYRWLTRDEADRLLAELPDHLEAMARFSLATGLRESNVRGLLWSQVDLERRAAWVHADQAKGKRSLSVPLNNDAVIVLREQQDRHPEYVFTYAGQPIASAVNNTAWRKAKNRAGLDDIRWHDLRHTWASWHVQNGTPLHVLQELGGWSSFEMVQRYAHLAPEHLAEWQDRLSRPRVIESAGAVWGTPPDGAQDKEA